MAALRSALLFVLLFASHILALQVTPNSPCASVCIDSTTLDESDPNSSNTGNSDIVCQDSDFSSTSSGTKWQGCLSCLQNSTFSQGTESDQEWFLYNLRYSFDYCVFSFPNGTGSGSNPCETSTACGSLRTALEDGNLDADSTSEFGYCDADGASMTGEFYSKCLDCVSAGGETNYIANALVALEAGCLQRPNSSQILGLNDTVFSTTIINIVDPSTLTKASDDNSTHLSIGAIAGIIVGILLLIVVVAAVTFIRYRKRKNRAMHVSPRWDQRHKRKSSFSFRCRRILASPMSPKFFRDIQEEEETPYSSIDVIAQSQVSGITGASETQEQQQERYHIESKHRLQQPSLAPWSPQDAPPSVQTITIPSQYPETPDGFMNFNKQEYRSEKKAITISTSHLPLATPPATHTSFAASRSSPQSAATSSDGGHSFTPTSTTQLMPPNLPLRYAPYVPASHITSPSENGEVKTTNIYASSPRSPTQLSPPMKQHGWPSSREPDMFFPPPPPPPPPKSSRYGRKSSGNQAKKTKRESGSPVESRQIQVTFPAPPKK